ncbi:hypothetical protein GCM10027040_26340 [Halomonas shantousis]
MDLLIHSLAEFKSITIPLLNIAKPHRVCEIGVEHAGNTQLIYEWAKNQDSSILGIDPSPSKAFYEWHKGKEDKVSIILKNSLSALEEARDVDFWFVDGDHNWYTVYHELIAIKNVSIKSNRKLLIALHDVSWPCARRDFYYDPTSIPEKFRHEYSWDLGVHLNSDNLVEGGFHGAGNFAIAKNLGGPKNGVLTAIEDFIKTDPESYCFAYIPGVFGLGILFEKSHEKAREIAEFLIPYHENELLKNLEKNRILNYLKVLEWQEGLKLS